jgi:hypothetical protein
MFNHQMHPPLSMRVFPSLYLQMHLLCRDIFFMILIVLYAGYKNMYRYIKYLYSTQELAYDQKYLRSVFNHQMHAPLRGDISIIIPPDAGLMHDYIIYDSYSPIFWLQEYMSIRRK